MNGRIAVGPHCCAGQKNGETQTPASTPGPTEGWGAGPHRGPEELEQPSRWGPEVVMVAVAAGVHCLPPGQPREPLR